MKKIKKLLALLMCAGLIVSSVPLKASAQSNEPATGTIVHVNPLYEDIMQESQILLADDEYEAPVLADTYYTTIEAAGDDMREQLKDRKATVTVGIKTTNDDLSAVCYALMDEAMKHTGVPDEGDYIMWQYGGWRAGYSSSTSGNYNLYSFSYEMSYYTTAAQEAIVDRKLEEIYDELDLDNATDYEQIKGCYDFICENITYDYENLYDDDYKLKHTAYAGLIDDTCVCQGYALILYRMALNYGVDARLIAGDAPGPHGWNIVQMGDKYYYADTTWDAGSSVYSYFLKGSNNFTDHAAWEDYTSDEFTSQYDISTTDYVSCAGSTNRNDHSYKTSRTEPTCTKAGSETEYCTVCGTKSSTTVIPALGHNYVDCVCTRCGDEDYPSSGSCGDSVNWEILDDGTLLVTGSGAIADDPLGSNFWFGSNDDIKSIVVSDGITSIGYGAFKGLNRVTSLTLPESLSSIGAYAFADCSSIFSLTIPASVNTIDIGAFSGCRNLRSITLPAGITAIESDVFANCTFLSSVTFPQTLTQIKSGAFSGCSGLVKITIPSSVTYIGEGAFANSGLKAITFVGNAPSFAGNCFSGVNATAFVPSGNTSWTSTVKQNYGGTIAWRIIGEPLASPVISATMTSAGKVKLTWSKVNGAVSYDLYRATGSSFDHLVTPSGASYTDTTAKRGRVYKYYIVATDVLGESSQSNTVSCTVSLTEPEVTASNVASSGKIKLTWDKVTNATKYEIYRSTSKNGTYKLMLTTTGTSYTNTSAKAGSYYYYKVKAVAYSDKASTYSAVVGRRCDLPRTTVTLSNVASTGKVKVSWTKVDGAVKYQVLRATTKNGTYSSIAKTENLSYIDKNTTAGKTYYYKVRAVHSNTNANSALTSWKSRMCDLKRPTVSITTSSGKPKVSWAGITGATKYRIYRSTSKNGTYSLVQTTTAKYWKDSTAKKGKTYYYKVVAVHSKSGANSAESTVKYIKCTK